MSYEWVCKHVKRTFLCTNYYSTACKQKTNEQEWRWTSIIRLSTRLYGRQCPRSSFHCHDTVSPRHCTAPLRALPSTANIPSVGSLGNSSLKQQFLASKQFQSFIYIKPIYIVNLLNTLVKYVLTTLTQIARIKQHNCSEATFKLHSK